MSTSPDQAREVARRIAARIGTEAPASGIASGDVAGLRATLTEISRRLDQIESRIAPNASSASQPVAYSPWTPPGSIHASQEKFDVQEAAVAEMVDYFEQSKKCELEPGGKPCDHCSMCSSRGF